MYKFILLSVLTLKLVVCAPHNTTRATSRNQTQRADSGELFDLTQLHKLNETDFDRNYFRIVRTFRKLGPESLRFINRTDLIETGFGRNSAETSAEHRTRWESVCDHFLNDGTQKFFKDFVLERVFKPPPAVKPPKKPPTNVRTLMDTEDAVPVKKK